MIRTLGLWSLIAILAVSSLAAAIGATSATGPWSASLLSRLLARWPGVLVDYGFFWAVAVSVVPIPFLEAWYRTAGGAATALAPEPPRRIAVKTGNGEALVAVGDILAVTAAENYVEVHLAERSLLHRATLAKMQDLLPAPAFLRVHRGAIVRLGAVTSVRRPRPNAVELVLESGRVVGVGRAYRSAVISALQDTVRHPS